jgi:mRNA-degrading endonuclease RelE of RelBE toxin-antitoxin system
MPTDAAPSPAVEVVFTPEFKRNLRQLAKKYRQIKTDVQPLLDALTQGQTPGDQIHGVRYTVFKARVKNSDSRKGKSGGYRIIYQRVHERLIILVTIYSKTEQADITPQDIRQIILDYEAQPTDETTPSEPTTLPSDTTVNETSVSP